MRKFIHSLLLSSSVFVASHAHAADSILIEDITIVSAHQEETFVSSVLIEDGLIKQISNDISVEDIKIINGTDKFLSYGIMDAHVHVSSIPGMGFNGEPIAQKHPELTAAFHEQQPRSLLYHGVTQILDPNPGVSWRRYTSQETHPDYYRCEVITTPQTFPFVEKDKAISSVIYPYVLDLKSDEQENLKEIQTTISKMKEDGARCVKLYFENGYGDDDQWPLLDASTLGTIRTVASENSLPILAHANATDMYEAAIDADVDVIVHGLWNWGSDNREREVPQSISNITTNLKNEKIAVMPSFRVMAGLADLMHQGAMDEAFKDITPSPLANWYKEEGAQWFRTEVISGFDNLPPEQIREIIQYGHLRRGILAFNEMRENGIQLILGSDTPGSPTFTNQPGLNTFQEMQMMHLAGMSTEEIFDIATYETPHYFNLSDKYGTVEVGKIANLLILDENPLATIDAWNSIDTIILHGETIKRESLKAD